MKILILGINFFPEQIGTAVYTTGMARYLAEAGHTVSVITANPYYPEWKVFQAFRSWAYSREVMSEGIRITRCPIYVPARPTGLKRILHLMSFALAAIPPLLGRLFGGRPDVVFVIAPSLISAPVGRLFAWMAGARAWLHVQDFEVEAAFAMGLLPEQGIAERLARGFERFVLRRFHRVSTISPPMVDRLVDKGVALERTYEFRNWADLGAIAPLDGPSPLKAELGIETPHVALYSGNIANKQGIEIVVEAARAMVNRDDLAFVICGDGPYMPALRARAEGLPNIRFFPLQPKERLAELLGLASIHLLPQLAGAADLLLPSKLANMLASGRPVVATADAGTRLAQEVEGVGLNVSPGNVGAFVEAITTLLDDDDLRRDMGRAARARCVEIWDGEKILSRLEHALCETIGETVQNSMRIRVEDVE